MEPVHPLDRLHRNFQSLYKFPCDYRTATSLATLWMLVLTVKPQKWVQQLLAQSIKDYLWVLVDRTDITDDKDHSRTCCVWSHETGTWPILLLLLSHLILTTSTCVRYYYYLQFAERDPVAQRESVTCPKERCPNSTWIRLTAHVLHNGVILSEVSRQVL